MAITKEIWVEDLRENLFPDNAFSNFALRHDAFVLDGKVVHVPGAGAKPTVARDRATLPATPATRTDADLSYTLVEYTTDPIYMRKAERYELSYDKRMSIIGEHAAALRQAVHDDMLNNWVGTVAGSPLPAGNIFDTSGTLTGGKRQILLDDIAELKLALDKADYPSDERYLLFPPELYNQLFGLQELAGSEMLAAQQLPTGTVHKLLGFTVLQRGRTVRYADAGTLKAVSDADAADDRLAVVAWSKYAVARALGEVNFFERLDDPGYYGDVYSAMVRASGSRMRADGVYVLRENNS